MFQSKVVGEIKTHVVCSFFFFLNRAIYETVWKNLVEPKRPHMTIWRVRKIWEKAWLLHGCVDCHFIV